MSHAVQEVGENEREKWKLFFQAADSDADGVIDSDDVISVLEAAGHSMTRDQAKVG